MTWKECEAAIDTVARDIRKQNLRVVKAFVPCPGAPSFHGHILGGITVEQSTEFRLQLSSGEFVQPK